MPNILRLFGHFSHISYHTTDHHSLVYAKERKKNHSIITQVVVTHEVYMVK